MCVAGMAGLAISLALGVTQSLNWSVRMASDLESQMVAVERLENFATMEQEAAHKIPHRDPSPDSQWPTAGDIKMTNVSMRYRKDLPLVLSGVTVHIAPREKVGVVGRTGAGMYASVTRVYMWMDPSQTCDGLYPSRPAPLVYLGGRLVALCVMAGLTPFHAPCPHWWR